MNEMLIFLKIYFSGFLFWSNLLKNLFFIYSVKLHGHALNILKIPQISRLKRIFTFENNKKSEFGVVRTCTICCFTDQKYFKIGTDSYKHKLFILWIAQLCTTLFKFDILKNIKIIQSLYFLSHLIYNNIYQPLRSGRIWHKVNF